jgi:hypothetical protein
MTTPERVHAPCPGRFGATGAESQCDLNLLFSFQRALSSCTTRSRRERSCQRRCHLGKTSWTYQTVLRAGIFAFRRFAGEHGLFSTTASGLFAVIAVMQPTATTPSSRASEYICCLPPAFARGIRSPVMVELVELRNIGTSEESWQLPWAGLSSPLLEVHDRDRE